MSFNVVISSPENGMDVNTFNNYEEALALFIHYCGDLGSKSDLAIMNSNNDSIGYKYNCWGRKEEFQVCIFPTPYNNDKEYKEKLAEIKALINEE